MNYDPLSDLSVFLAYSLELEQESAERLREFAGIMEAHHQDTLARTFTELAVYSDRHAAEVARICSSHNLPALKPWEFDWPGDEPPETSGYDAVSYEMTVRQALEAMLEQEQGSAEFYADVAIRTTNAEIREYAMNFAAEEREHARALEQWLKKLGDDRSPPDIDPPQVVD